MEEKLIQRLESAVARLEELSAGVQSRGLPGGVGDAALSGVDVAADPSIVAFDDLMGEYVGRFSSAAEKIGGQVLDVTNIVKEAFAVQKDLLIKVKQTQKPDLAGLAEFLRPLNEVVTKATVMTEGKRSDFFNHLKAAVDSLSALAWIAFTGKDCGMSMPIAHVEESWQMAEFYNNKVLVEYRNKDQNHVEWAKALKELYVPGLRDYVKSFYPLGPVWSPTGKPVALSKAPTPGAPAPPPRPSSSLFSSDSSQASSSKPIKEMSAVFQEINSGNVTGGLRKVTADMKTKNRADRTGIVSASEKESHAPSPSSSKVGPPKFELQMGRKWAVENQIGKKDLVIDDCDSKQSVYIYGCKDSVLQIQGKVNNITVDKCTKMGVVFKDVVAACEIVNCNRVEVQCQGSAPTISVDNTSGCQLYLNKDSLEASISTAKSSEINVLVPGAEPDGDWAEHSLPQQYIHVYKDGRFETTSASHSGGFLLLECFSLVRYNMHLDLSFQRIHTLTVFIVETCFIILVSAYFEDRTCVSRRPAWPGQDSFISTSTPQFKLLHFQLITWCRWWEIALSVSAMATLSHPSLLLLCLSLIIIAFSFAESQSFIGVNYGQVADNHPAPADTVKLLQSTSIGKVRLYGVDPAIIKALANTGIGIVIGTANGDVPNLASDPNSATQWVNANVLPYYPASNITLITVGNEVMTSGDQGLISQLVPAMRNIQTALSSASLGGKIKVSTVHSMAVLTQSDPPSSGLFNPGFQDTMKQLLTFLNDNKSPFTINPYPFFAYQSDPRPETLAFCLFQPNSGRVDSGNGKLYTNMFDAQVDAVHSALGNVGFQDVEIVVAETGWPSRGDSNEVGPSVENAKAYNGNLVTHLRSMVGTPLMPGKSVDTYIFALYDEDLKPGPGSERAFGLFSTDLTMAYDVGLAKTIQQTPKTPVTPASGWCVPKAGVSDAQLQANLDYACSHGIDCGPIQPGGACFEPNTVASHAAYAMNVYYQTVGKNPWNCDFSQSATLTSQNPSYNACVYPGGST
ncbi:hypothetical protein L6164_035570 [Bauhinia variegata]|uniref:Uncharacterized protein n=1 Tax=Bauhinia variegata TaxID=167791 RepID=A0ACB9KEE3_BAUVA|nr:hypothetical protein L6164_035570 [Bauhinia variegata]